MKSKTNRNGRPILLGLLFFFCITCLVFTASAQDGGGDPDESALAGRDQERKAPYREPEIMFQQMDADGATNTVISLPAVADTYIASERPFENFGSDSLFLGYNLLGDNNYGAQRLLLRFEVDTYVPDGAVIHSAVLRLRLSLASPPNDPPMGTVLRRLASPWTEFGVTWNSEPTWTAIDSQTAVGSGSGWYEWDATELVSGWVHDDYDNDGVEIIGDEAVQQRERAFFSRETTTSYYPQLIIDYTDTGDTLPPIITVDDLPQYSGRSFTVSWDGSDQGLSGIDYYDVQVRVDGGAWTDWQTGTTDTSMTFTGAENGRLYEFRARGVDNVGNVEPYGGPEASTRVDTAPPTTTVDPLPAIINTDAVTVSWTGSDAGSGIQYYDVFMRMDGGSWVLWQSQTLATSVVASNLDDGFYQFEARAVDNLGFVEPFQENAEASIIVDADPPFVQPQLWLPVVAHGPAN